ncbi:phasin family protein [Skermanella sp. TT6]|uniref:Phasin family protein n=1 Tax=Skermanella cutis TaxID=2775420 RepID=A0ABX7BAQ5_9PROT|nr:phasin family protein [Skermanella sp. TT6]QQP91479.1 phasin family protein [Skermanella sp. TT6]
MADDKGNTGAAATGRGTQQAENALRQGADQLRNQMGNMADVAGMSAKVSQEMIQRSGQNFEMMKRIAETMTSGARSAAAECAEYAKHSAKRQSEMMQQLASARSPNDVLDIQNRYLQDNLKELLSFSERLSRLSADKAKEASERLDNKG